MLSFSFITGQVSHTASYTSIYHCLQVTTRCSSILSDKMCVSVAASTVRCCLHSAVCGDLMVPKTRTITYGSRRFAVSGPCVWNDLPLTSCASSTTLGQFQSRLKTISLGLWDVTWHFH